jgi:hypothetical protein
VLHTWNHQEVNTSLPHQTFHMYLTQVALLANPAILRVLDLGNHPSRGMWAFKFALGVWCGVPARACTGHR